MAKRLLLVVNSFEFFLSHRLQIALAALDKGFEVHVASDGKAPVALDEMGLYSHSIPLSRGGVKPWSEAWSVWKLAMLFRHVRPDLVHLVTTKPVIYGSLAARATGVPQVVVAIAGLGSLFVEQERRWSYLSTLVKWAYRLALGHRNLKAIFQNPDDRSFLVNLGAVSEEQTVLIRGSGVSLDDYPYLPEPQGMPVITMAARLLADKGVREFIEAARLIRQRGLVADFRLLGDPDSGNPRTITESELEHWRAEGVVELPGFRRDIATQYAQSNIVCLPSYREGLPKSLVEAAACGRAVVTTDMPGCRDAIEPGRSGLLVPASDAESLADAIQYLIEHPAERQAMGAAGRELAEREFAIEKIVEQHLMIYRELDRLDARCTA